MTVIDHRPSPLASQVLKLVGILLILSFLIEFAVLLINPEFSNPQWGLTLMTQVIDRGVTPLIGFALLYAGFWMHSAAVGDRAPGSGATWQNSRFWAFVVASLLGLLFLILIPLYLTTTGKITQQAVENINQQASQTEIQLQQQQAQLKSLAESGQIDQLIGSGQVPPEQVALLQQLKQDPKALDKQVEQRQAEISTQQQQAVKQAKSEAFKTRLRAGLRSLLLAIGFATIGWSGLRESS